MAAVTAVACVALTVWTFLPQQEDGLVLYEGQFSEVQLVNSMIKQLVEDRYDLTVTIKDSDDGCQQLQCYDRPGPQL